MTGFALQIGAWYRMQLDRQAWFACLMQRRCGIGGQKIQQKRHHATISTMALQKRFQLKAREHSGAKAMLSFLDVVGASAHARSRSFTCTHDIYASVCSVYTKVMHTCLASCIFCMHGVYMYKRVECDTFAGAAYHLVSIETLVG